MVDIRLNLQFSPENFALGVAAGWASAYAVYRARHVLGSARSALTQQAASAQNFATRTADSRYIEDLLKTCESHHLAGKAIKLSQILVEPRFIPAPPLAAPHDEGELPSVFRVVPHVPDFPWLQAAYNIETLSIEELGNGARAIALLGQPGSGRTTALQAIALWSLGRVEFKPPLDKVQERLAQEEEELSNEDRGKRLKERLKMEEMAMQSLAKSRGGESEGGKETGIPVFRQLTPVYAHLSNISVSTSEFGRQIDPAEPLVRAVQHHVSGATAKTIPRKLYERLNEGKVLLLLDGFDEVPVSEQAEKLAWLRAFMAEYSSNFVIVTAAPNGYGGLPRSGFAPVFVRPWSDVQAETAVANWTEHWGQISGRRRGGARPPLEAVSAARSSNRALSPFEMTLKLWGIFEDAAQTDTESWMRGVLVRYLPGNQPIGVILPQLARMAALQLDEGFITPARLEQTLSGQPIISGSDSAEEEDHFDDHAETFEEDEPNPFERDSDEDLEALFGEDSGRKKKAQTKTAAKSTPRPTQAGRTQKSEKPAKTQASASQHNALLNALRKSGLLLLDREGRYTFRHPLFAGYLASLYFKELAPDQQMEKAVLPSWREALIFAAQHTPLDSIVRSRLTSTSDVLNHQVLEMAGWLAYSGQKTAWRGDLLKLLGNLFVAPNQYLPLRERIAAALVGTRDKSAATIFKRSLNHPDNNVRRLACLGLGALRDESSIQELAALLSDKSTEVQLAAGLALGAVGTQAALEEMVEGLTEGNEQLRQAIAESFAAIPDEGYPVLYDAINHEEMMLRRAAVFGLRRVNTSWAVLVLYRTAMEDEQWYVRSAAEQAFYDMQYGSTASGVRPYPAVESIPWLREWIAMQGEEIVREVEKPEDLLLMALADGDPQLQSLSVANIGQLGIATHVSELYMALRHQDQAVRDAAYQALGELQLQIGQPLPSPS